MKDLLKSPKNLKKTLSYTATQSQLSCKPNSNLAHPWTQKKKKKTTLVEEVKNDMSIKEVTKPDNIEWRKIIHVVDLD